MGGCWIAHAGIDYRCGVELGELGDEVTADTPGSAVDQGGDHGEVMISLESGYRMRIWARMRGDPRTTPAL